MGILSIFKKTIKGVKDSIGLGGGDDFDLDAELGDLGAESASAGEPIAEEPLNEEPFAEPKSAPEEPHLDAPEEDLLEEPSKPELAPEPEPPAAPAPPAQASVDTSQILLSLENVKTKLDVVQARFDSLESKTSYQRSETERYMQYLSYLNEKLDHLQEEQMEIERLLKEK